VGRKPKHPRDSYGAWLHHLRTELGLTQQGLSNLTGIQQRTLAHWERTGKLAGRKEILKLAKALKVSVSELLREKHKSDLEKDPSVPTEEIQKVPRRKLKGLKP
jgi:transcriptional regulator with XRE-family HTH domain